MRSSSRGRGGRRPSSSHGSRSSGTRSSHCPLVEIEPLGDEPVDVAGYDWVVVTSVNGARELRRRLDGTPQAGGRDRPSDGGGVRRRRPRARGLDAGGPAGRAAAAGRQRALRGRGGGAPAARRRARRDFVPLYRTRELDPPEPPTETSSCSPRVGGARLRAHSGRLSPPFRSGRRRRGPPGRPASRWSPRRRRTISTGLLAVARAAG